MNDQGRPDAASLFGLASLDDESARLLAERNGTPAMRLEYALLEADRRLSDAEAAAEALAHAGGNRLDVEFAYDAAHLAWTNEVESIVAAYAREHAAASPGPGAGDPALPHNPARGSGTSLLAAYLMERGGGWEIGAWRHVVAGYSEGIQARAAAPAAEEPTPARGDAGPPPAVEITTRWAVRFTDPGSRVAGVPSVETCADEAAARHGAQHPFVRVRPNAWDGEVVSQTVMTSPWEATPGAPPTVAQLARLAEAATERLRQLAGSRPLSDEDAILVADSLRAARSMGAAHPIRLAEPAMRSRRQAAGRPVDFPHDVKPAAPGERGAPANQAPGAAGATKGVRPS